jgi:hypothetical protein
MEQDMKVVSIVLSLGSLVFPVLFGFVVWKMSQIFATKVELADHKQAMEELKHRLADNEEKLSRQLDHINTQLVELLQRTSSMR